MSEQPDGLRVALVTEVFHDDPDGSRLADRLAEAKRGGADLAVLPELPLNPWSPAFRGDSRDEDAEGPGGPRFGRLCDAAADAEIALLGGAIVRDAETGRRHNTAFLFDASGASLGDYRKVHLPYEDGFWEADHYEPGDEPPRVMELAGWRVGLQICSDINRPFGCQVLAARGAELLLVPRATPEETYARWRLILRAAAVTAGAYLISVNRPGPEAGVPIGAPSIAIAPDGEVISESLDPVAFVDLSSSELADARREYPGYLSRPVELYRRGWAEVESASS